MRGEPTKYDKLSLAVYCTLHNAKNVCSFVRRQACPVCLRFVEKGNLTAMSMKKRNAKSGNWEMVHQVLF